MARKIQFRRGVEVNLPQLDIAEFGFTTDTNKLFIGGSDRNIEFVKSEDLQQISLAYKESYATLTDLQTAYPVGDAYNHVVLADGMIYTFANDAWVNTNISADGTTELLETLTEENEVWVV